MSSPLDVRQVFGRELRPDPDVALNPAGIQLPTNAPGPAHRAQFVVELVGPRTVPAQAIHALVQPQRAASLGHPHIWVMAAADVAWRAPRQSDTSYDSVACAWDFESASGSITPQSAHHLTQALEAFGQPLGRRAAPMPTPDDVPKAIKLAKDLQDRFDVGVELGVVTHSAGFREADIWVACVELGLDMGPSGGFEWRIPSWDGPLLTVATWEEPFEFSLRAVTAQALHSAIGIGFSIPRSPDPVFAIDKSIQVALKLADRLNGIAIDDQERALTDRSAQKMRDEVSLVARSMAEAGIAPGSASALKLFPEGGSA